MLVHRRVTPSIKFDGTHLYTWVERGVVRVKCLTQEHNIRSPARAPAQTARSGIELTNHEAIVPPRPLTDLQTLWLRCAEKLISELPYNMQFQKTSLLPPHKGLKFPTGRGRGPVKPKHFTKYMKLRWNF